MHVAQPITAASADEETDVDAELSTYLTGAQAVPVPTYFVGSFGAGSRRAMAALAASSAIDITYLGRRSDAEGALAATHEQMSGLRLVTTDLCVLLEARISMQVLDRRVPTEESCVGVLRCIRL